jgi:hypothetical protein
MRTVRYPLILATLAALLVAGSVTTARQAPTQAPTQTTAVTTPMQAFGHNLGDNYYLANYQQASAYWQTLARESNRIQVVEIGRTSLDRPHYMAIITSPDNFSRLDRYKEIARRLQLAERVERRAGPRAGGGREGRGLDRRRPARHRGAWCPAARRAGLPDGFPQR